MTLQLGDQNLDLYAILGTLAKKRPIFHSEADFQFALAWQIKKSMQKVKVRLEAQPPEWLALLTERDIETHRRLDIELRRGDSRIGIEVKYLKNQKPQKFGDEQFPAGADPFDTRSFDVVNDLVRIEKYVKAYDGAQGAVVILSGRSGFWSPGSRRDVVSIYDQFRINDGLVLEKRLSWGSKASPGSRGSRPEYLDLAGRYELKWREYSREPVEHKALVLEVQAL